MSQLDHSRPAFHVWRRRLPLTPAFASLTARIEGPAKPVPQRRSGLLPIAVHHDRVGAAFHDNRACPVINRSQPDIARRDEMVHVTAEDQQFRHAPRERSEGRPSQGLAAGLFGDVVHAPKEQLTEFWRGSMSEKAALYSVEIGSPESSQEGFAKLVGQLRILREHDGRRAHQTMGSNGAEEDRASRPASAFEEVLDDSTAERVPDYNGRRADLLERPIYIGREVTKAKLTDFLAASAGAMASKAKGIGVVTKLREM